MKVIRVTALVVVAALGTDSFTVDSDVGIGNVFFIVNLNYKLFLKEIYVL